jgi:hypothetical protein
MTMVNKMKETLAKKDAAIKTLEAKSRALKKKTEPRNAYKLTKSDS